MVERLGWIGALVLAIGLAGCGETDPAAKEKQIRTQLVVVTKRIEDYKTNKVEGVEAELEELEQWKGELEAELSELTAAKQ